MFDKQMLKKPSHLPSRSLVAVIGIYDTPQTTRNVMTGIPYIKSELAVNERTGKVQVYVMADNNGGLQAFQQDYPNAEIKSDATIEDSDDWRVIAFPTEAMPDESTPLDNFYQGTVKENKE